MTFAPSKMQVASSDFRNRHDIPEPHSYDGENISPELHWHGLPDAAESIAVFCHDPDAPLVSAAGTYGYVHWLVYNIPATISALPRGCKDYAQGTNDYGELGYGGPQPPKGHGLHHYFFWVLALDRALALESGLELSAFLQKAEPHVLGMNRMIGYYEVK